MRSFHLPAPSTSPSLSASSSFIVVASSGLMRYWYVLVSEFPPLSLTLFVVTNRKPTLSRTDLMVDLIVVKVQAG